MRLNRDDEREKTSKDVEIIFYDPKGSRMYWGCLCQSSFFLLAPTYPCWHTHFMKNHNYFLFSCALLLFLAPCAGVQADSPLEKKMNQMRKSFRELKKAMVAPVEADKQKYLAWVVDLKSGAEASEILEPEKTSKIPSDQKAAFLEGYKNKLDELVDEIDALGKAIEAGKWDEAKSLVTQINQIQREGHEKYRMENNEH